MQRIKIKERAEIRNILVLENWVWLKYEKINLDHRIKHLLLYEYTNTHGYTKMQTGQIVTESLKWISNSYPKTDLSTS